MKEKDGHFYSMEQFEGYKYRAKVTVTSKESERSADVYTTNESREELERLMQKSIDKSNEGGIVKIINWSSAEQDRLTSEMIDEWLKEV